MGQLKRGITMNTFMITNEQLDEILGFSISDDSFFSEGCVIMFDGLPVHLKEAVGDQLIFEYVNAEQRFDAQKNLEFFYDRSVK